MTPKVQTKQYCICIQQQLQASRSHVPNQESTIAFFAPYALCQRRYFKKLIMKERYFFTDFFTAGGAATVATSGFAGLISVSRFFSIAP